MKKKVNITKMCSLVKIFSDDISWRLPLIGGSQFKEIWCVIVILWLLSSTKTYRMVLLITSVGGISFLTERMLSKKRSTNILSEIRLCYTYPHVSTYSI